MTRDPSLSAEKFTESEAVAINFLASFPSYREVAVKGYDYYFPGEAVRFLEGGRPRSECPQGPNDSPLCAVLPKEGHRMELYKGRPLGSVDLAPIYEGLMKKHYQPPNAADSSAPTFNLELEEMTFEDALPSGKLRLSFDQIRLEKHGANIYPDYVRFSLLFKEGT